MAAGLLLLVSACAFSSVAPLLDAANAVQPFADGARFQWTSPDGEDAPFAVQYRRVDEGAYEIIGVREEDPSPMRVQFFDVPETPEEDYIVQARMEPNEGWYYGFIWRSGDDYLIYTSPAILNDGQGPSLREAHCVARTFGQCEIRSADALRQIYLQQIYASYVRFGLRQGAFVQSSISRGTKSTP